MERGAKDRWGVVGKRRRNTETKKTEKEEHEKETARMEKMWKITPSGERFEGGKKNKSPGNARNDFFFALTTSPRGCVWEWGKSELIVGKTVFTPWPRNLDSCFLSRSPFAHYFSPRLSPFSNFSLRGMSRTQVFESDPRASPRGFSDTPFAEEFPRHEERKKIYKRKRDGKKRFFPFLPLAKGEFTPFRQPHAQQQRDPSFSPSPRFPKTS